MSEIKVKWALDVIEDDLRHRWHPGATDAVDVWRPDGSPGNCFTDESLGRRRLKPPALMADDGNFLIAVVPVLAERQAQSDGKFARDIDLLGNMLRRAALNLGLHRLVVLLVLPENESVLLAVPSAFTKEKPGAGRFRVVVLPHAEVAEAEFEEGLRLRRAVVGPLPAEPFLEDIDEVQLAQYLPEVIGDMDPPKEMREAIQADLEALLRGQTDVEQNRWLHTTDRLNNLVNTVTTEENQEEP